MMTYELMRFVSKAGSRYALFKNFFSYRQNWNYAIHYFKIPSDEIINLLNDSIHVAAPNAVHVELLQRKRKKKKKKKDEISWCKIE